MYDSGESVGSCDILLYTNGTGECFIYFRGDCFNDVTGDYFIEGIGEKLWVYTSFGFSLWNDDSIFDEDFIKLPFSFFYKDLVSF